MFFTKKFFYRILCGFFLGVSVFAPGFSGSVIAIIMGIYQDILRITSNPFKDLKQNIIFCIPLGIGVLISGVMFVLSFEYLFETYEKATYLLFIGLIFGNLPVIYEEIKRCKFKAHYLFGGIVAFAAALALGLAAAGTAGTSVADGATAGNLLFALAGLAAGATALIPGMSVSVILIVMGAYTQILSAAKALMHIQLDYLLPFALFGIFAAVGLVLTSRLIKRTFEKYPGFANSTVFGFMTGSLIGIFVQSQRIVEVNFNWLIGGGMLVTGLVVSIVFVILGKAMNKS